jgi:hypothetical protein
MSKDNKETEVAELIKHFTTVLAETKQTKVKEPNTYDGTRDALLIDGWIRSVERYSTFHAWNAERSCLFGATLLRDRADAWFRTIENTDEAPTTWLEFKRLLIAFFRPENSVRVARDKLAVLVQRGAVVDYINSFMDIKLSIPTMTDEEAHDKFIRGLSSKQMRAHIRQYESDTLKDAIQAALAYDSAQMEEDYFQVRATVRTAQQGVIYDPMEVDAIDHRRSGYSNSSRNNSYNRNNGNGTVCYYCQKPGHFKRNCRTRIADIKKLDQQHANQRKQDFQ